MRYCAPVLALYFVLSAVGAVVGESVRIPLWENGAPGDPATKPADEPALFLWKPEKQDAARAAAIVIPGGGYGGLAIDHEGKQIAEWFNSLGITAFVLQYRHGGTGHKHPIPMEDGQRAIRLVRTRAKDWNIDPAKVLVMGFSAGGHLASTLATHFDAGNPDTDEAIHHASSRPDALVLCYPVITMTEPHMHEGSRNNLLGKEPKDELARNLSNDLQVTAETPPTFIFQTNEDAAVKAENCVSFYLALRRAGVPVEMHIYQDGRHGVGLARVLPATSTWPDRLRDWLQVRGLLAKNRPREK